jgi:CBS domain-containing protein
MDPPRVTQGSAPIYVKARDLTRMMRYEGTRSEKNQDGGQGLRTVREIMTTELVTVGPSINLIEAARAMSAGHAGSVLVVQHGALVGIFTERDMLRAMAQSSKADAGRVSSVSKWMTRDPLTVAPDTPVGEALDQMLSGGFRHLPVMEADALVGVVSMRDLAKSISKE